MIREFLQITQNDLFVMYGFCHSTPHFVTNLKCICDGNMKRDLIRIFEKIELRISLESRDYEDDEYLKIITISHTDA